MNWKLISLVALAGSHIAASAIEIASNRYYRKLAKLKAVDIRPAEASEMLQNAQDGIKAYRKLQERENGAMKMQMAEAKRTMRYDARKHDIYSGAEENLRQFKKSIQYEAKKKEFEAAAENEIAAFKSSLNYDSTIADLKKKISEANATCEAQMKSVSNVGADMSEAAAEYKLQAEKAKNKIVNEAEARIKELTDKVSAEATRVNGVKQAEIQKLESQVLNEQTRLNNAAQEELKALEQELGKAKSDISAGIEKARTKDDLKAIEQFSANEDAVRNAAAADAERASDIYHNAAHYEKLAAWFKAHTVPKWCVAVMGTLPLIPLGYLTVRYVTLVVHVIAAM